MGHLIAQAQHACPRDQISAQLLTLKIKVVTLRSGAIPEGSACTSACQWSRVPKDCNKSAVMGGQQDFMASQKVLQHTLLPLLSAPDLVRLGLTCKALLAWVWSTPPAVWQVMLCDV